MPMVVACPTVKTDAELSDSQLAANTLAAGLRALRVKGLLCDVALVAGEEKIHAHQAVLAAASLPLRGYFAEGAQPKHQPLELRMTGGEQPEALRALLDAAYGAEGAAPPPVATAAGALARSLALQAEPTALAAGLRELRVKGRLCDLALVVGGERLPAHQAVLAAASAPLRTYILDGLDRLRDGKEGSAVDGAEAAGAAVTSEPLELELEGVSCATAATVMLDHVYGASDGAALPEAESAIRDVLRLASALELPRLRERAAQWLVRGVSATNAPQRLSICDEFGFSALHNRIKELSGQTITPEVKREVQAPADAAAGGRHESPQDAILADPALMSGLTELECAMLNVCMANFSEGSVPDAPRKQTVESMEECRTRQDVRTLERLYDLFDQRPVWLEAPLLKQLPMGIDRSTLMKLLPCVAYQWRDGPWHSAFTRYGWDPRDHPEEAKWLQVVDFRDPQLRTKAARPVARGSQAASDCHFRRPPTQWKEHYQLVDIKDDFVAELVKASEPSGECLRKTGWLEPVVLEALQERLAVRSQQLRERQALREQAEKGKKRAAGRRSSVGSGKRLRAAGA
mmetsp:Transcript_77667/g.240662  ORF Transcript_77667/g.240662 Transcript_77667/m.240662 type:complete len:575 (-) Transcript_77667:130-1854(-)